jgi:hypothetical protein
MRKAYMSAFKVSVRPRTDVINADPAVSSSTAPAMNSLRIDHPAMSCVNAPALNSSDAVMSCAPAVAAEFAGRELSPLSSR